MKTTKIKKILIEGLDRLGKSTLADNIQANYGHFQKIHFGKPLNLPHYSEHKKKFQHIKMSEAELYQRHSFENMFKLIDSDARIIFDRAHLGENVYSPIYRGYAGSYVYDYELSYDLGHRDDTLLVLLIEDFAIAKHFVDDGLSFDITKREHEQQLFLEAFNKSRFKNKKVVCVTDQACGGFRAPDQILLEVMSKYDVKD